MARACRIVSAAALSLLALVASPGRAAQLAGLGVDLGCGPQVSRTGGGIAVAPGGGDDTAALQCALDAAIASGQPSAIRLSPGTFHVAQLVARGFAGTIQGSGANSTVLTNVARPVYVAPVDMYLAEPSAENPWPALVAFVGGDLDVSDLTVRITGEAPTTGWSIFGIDPPIKAFSSAFVVLGPRATARFTGVQIEGAPAPGDLFGLNLINGIFFEGFAGTNDLAPISGRFEVHRCVMRQLGSPVPVFNLRDAEVAITANRFEGTLGGGEIADLDHVTYAFSGNRVDSGWGGVQAYDNCLGGSSICGVQASSITIAGNDIRSFDGVEIFSTFGPDVACTIAGNEIAYDAANGGVAVWLGRGTRGCFVVTEGAVRDGGTNNRIVTHP